MTVEKRTAPRYFVTSSLAGKVDGFDVDVVDISVQGARLETTQSLASGSPVTFSLQCSGAQVIIRATVQWCELAAMALHDEESDRYLCGLAFERPVPVIGHLVGDLLASRDALAMEETRRSERYRVISQLAASFGASAGARLLDVSVNGARIATGSLLEVGISAPLQFRILGAEEPVDVPATVVWSRGAERKGRFESGLRIEGQEDWLRSVIDELSQRNSAVLEHGSLRRKFDPIAVKPHAGLMAILR